MGNTLERAQTAFDRVSRYTSGDELLRTVRYYLGDRIVQQMTGEELAKLRACLWSLHQGAQQAGAEDERHKHARLEDNQIELLANTRAKEKLAWVLDNFDSLTTED